MVNEVVLARNIRDIYLVRIINSKKENIDAINHEYALSLTNKYGFISKVKLIGHFSIDFNIESNFANFLNILILRAVSEGNFNELYSIEDLKTPYFYLKNLILEEELRNKDNLEYLLIRFPEYIWYLSDDVIYLDTTIDAIVELLVLDSSGLYENIMEMLEQVNKNSKRAKQLEKILKRVKEFK